MKNNQYGVSYCETCNVNEPDVQLKEREVNRPFKEKTFLITETVAECSVCGNETYDEKRANETLKKLNELYINN